MKLRGCGFPVALLLLSLLLSGCQTTALRSIGLDGSPMPIDDPRADQVLSDYLAAADGRSALRGSARVSLSGPDFKLNRPQRIVIERPGRLRFEVLGLFDQVAAILASDGQRFGFFDAESGKISRGYVTPTLLWDLAKIDLAPEEVVGLLLGSPIPSPGLARAGVWQEAAGRLVVAFAWPAVDPPPGCEGNAEKSFFEPTCYVGEAALSEGGEVFFFNAQGRLEEIRSLVEDGEVRFRAVFDDYGALGGPNGVNFPNRVTIRSPGVDSEARFIWKRVMLASDLSDRFFTLPEHRNSAQDPG